MAEKALLTVFRPANRLFNELKFRINIGTNQSSLVSIGVVSTERSEFLSAKMRENGSRTWKMNISGIYIPPLTVLLSAVWPIWLRMPPWGHIGQCYARNYFLENFPTQALTQVLPKVLNSPVNRRVKEAIVPQATQFSKLCSNQRQAQTKWTRRKRKSSAS